MAIPTAAKWALGVIAAGGVAYGVSRAVAPKKKKKVKAKPEAVPLPGGTQTPTPTDPADPPPADPTDPQPPPPPPKPPGGIQPPPPPPTQPPPIGTPPTPPTPPPSGPSDFGGVEPPEEIEVYQLMMPGQFCTGEGMEYFAAVMPRPYGGAGEGSVLLEFCATGPVRYAGEWTGPDQGGALCVEGDDWIRAVWPDDPDYAWCLRIERIPAD